MSIDELFDLIDKYTETREQVKDVERENTPFGGDPRPLERAVTAARSELAEARAALLEGLLVFIKEINT